MPACPSSTSTICLVGLAPTWRAKAASSTSKSAMLTGRRQMKDGAPRGGMDKADEVAPLVAMLDRRDGRWPSRAPDLAQDRFQPNAVFVDGPQLDGRVGEGRRDLAQQWAQTLLEVRLRLRVGLHMARARHSQTCAQPPQIDPTQLTTDGRPRRCAHPGGDRASAPAVVLRSAAAPAPPRNSSCCDAVNSCRCWACLVSRSLTPSGPCAL